MSLPTKAIFKKSNGEIVAEEFVNIGWVYDESQLPRMFYELYEQGNIPDTFQSVQVYGKEYTYLDICLFINKAKGKELERKKKEYQYKKENMSFDEVAIKILPIVRRGIPRMIADDITGIQPMAEQQSEFTKNLKTLTKNYNETEMNEFLKRMYNWEIKQAFNRAKNVEGFDNTALTLLERYAKRFGDCGWQEGEVFEELRVGLNNVAAHIGYEWDDNLEYWVKEKETVNIESLHSYIVDMLSDFLYYNRKEDEDLTIDMIDEALRSGTVTPTEIALVVQQELNGYVDKLQKS